MHSRAYVTQTECCLHRASIATAQSPRNTTKTPDRSRGPLLIRTILCCSHSFDQVSHCAFAFAVDARGERGPHFVVSHHSVLVAVVPLELHSLTGFPCPIWAQWHSPHGGTSFFLVRPGTVPGTTKGRVPAMPREPSESNVGRMWAAVSATPRAIRPHFPATTPLLPTNFSLTGYFRSPSRRPRSPRPCR